MTARDLSFPDDATQLYIILICPCEFLEMKESLGLIEALHQ